MLGTKKFEKTILRLMVIVLVFSLILVCFPNMFSWISNDTAGEEYPIKIFGKEIINIEISADEDEWNEMIENKMSKPYISCNVKIDGHEFADVGIRPKGNSSLTSTQGNRISYRLDFDHYIDNQTCYGLEQMIINNLQADATYMKDYIAYDLMTYEGVNAPLHTHAFITLNGEPFGVYLAVEVYDEDYLTRVYNDTDVKLYSVKSSGFNDFEKADVDSEKATVIKSYGIEKSSGMGGMPPPPPPGGMGGPGMPPGMQGEEGQGGMMPPPPPGGFGENGEGGMMPPPPPGTQGGGGDLVYVDDSTDSYKTIFANAISQNADAKDFAKVIRAIKYLNKENVTNEELEKYWDVDAALRYLAVHTFMVNADSYSGHMVQNYYLAEQNGKITILPWDYNLSFGSMGGPPPGGPGGMPNGENRDRSKGQVSNNETTETINHAIDTPVIGVDMDSRPLISVLLSRDEYKEKYHYYLDELTKYASGDFINKLEIIESKIYPYIEKETVSFYTPEAHKKGFEVLKKFLDLRCQSIQGQLNGTIPSETDLQKGAELITADFSVNEMGSMGGPGGGPPPPPPGMHGENGQDGMMPPPPPGMPGMQQPQNNTNYYLIILLALVILGFVFVYAKIIERKY